MNEPQVCRRCQFVGEPAFDGKCKKCGSRLSAMTSGGRGNTISDSIKGGSMYEGGDWKCRGCGVNNESTRSSCNECGYSARSEATANEAALLASFATISPHYISEIADSIVWENNINEVDKGPNKNPGATPNEMTPRELAENPPRWIPREHHKTWSEMVLDKGVKSYPAAVSIFKRKIAKVGQDALARNNNISQDTLHNLIATDKDPDVKVNLAKNKKLHQLDPDEVADLWDTLRHAGRDKK